MTSTIEKDERREHERFRVRKDACVALGSSFRHVGQIIDIGMGGLSFRYVPTSHLSEGELELDIFMAGSPSYLYRFPFRTVFDLGEDEENRSPAIEMRRYGLEFGQLTQRQASQLGHFIQNYTVGGL
jgi:hypothetical protein